MTPHDDEHEIVTLPLAMAKNIMTPPPSTKYLLLNVHTEAYLSNIDTGTVYCYFFNKIILKLKLTLN